jgi:hypothetical protein
MPEKISTLITRITELKPNAYTSTTFLGWFNHVDGAVWNEIYKYTAPLDILRQANVSAYDLPVGISFNMITEVYLEGDPIHPIENGEPDTTGYFRGVDGKINIYPAPAENDVKTGLRIVYKLPYIKHESVDEEVFMQSPYDKAYDDYNAAMIDKYNQEMDGFNNNMTFYNGDFDDFADWYKKGKGQEG